MTVNVIGLDPGPVPGMVTLHYVQHPAWSLESVHSYQCSAATAPKLLEFLLDEYRDAWAPGGGALPGWTAGGIERYAESNLKSKHRHGGLTARQEHELTVIAAGRGVRLGCLPASTVKTWASDRRMSKSGVWPAIPTKLVHARSAGQVALYWAVRAAGVPDPLSAKWAGPANCIESEC